MSFIELTNPDGYTISTDKARLQPVQIHYFLSNHSYWAQGIPFETVRRSIDHSLCFGLYDHDEQVGFARIITDHATFAYLCDVFMVEAHRGRGLLEVVDGSDFRTSFFARFAPLAAGYRRCARLVRTIWFYFLAHARTVDVYCESKHLPTKKPSRRNALKVLKTENAVCYKHRTPMG